MRINKKAIIFIALLLTGFAILSGCKTSVISKLSSTQTASPTLKDTDVTTIKPSSSSTETQGVISTTTIIQTEYPRQTPTPTLTPTPTRQPTFTRTRPPTDTLKPPTPQNTLSPGDAQARVKELLKDNGGCKLPCIWGNTPGKTSMDLVRGYIMKFGTGGDEKFNVRSVDYGNMGGVSSQFHQNIRVRYDLRVYFDFHYYGGGDILNHIQLNTGLIYEERDKTGELINSDALYGGHSFFKGLAGYYFLPEMLKNYGVPSIVLVYPKPYDRERDGEVLTFSIVIIDYDNGFAVEYITLKEPSGNYIVGCPSKTAYIGLTAWDSTDKPTLEEIMTTFKPGYDIDSETKDLFKPIEEVTSMTIEDFYKTFQNPNACIRVPKKL